MSEQTKTNIQNDNNNIYTYLHILISLYLRNRTFNPIMRKYSINYNCITFLIGCWLYSQYVRKDIKISNIQIFTGYYTIYKCKKFMNQLIELRFMTLAGKSYYITENISVILDEIKQSYDNTVYNLCNTHNIEL